MRRFGGLCSVPWGCRGGWLVGCSSSSYHKVLNRALPLALLSVSVLWEDADSCLLGLCAVGQEPATDVCKQGGVGPAGWRPAQTLCVSARPGREPHSQGNLARVTPNVQHSTEMTGYSRHVGRHAGAGPILNVVTGEVSALGISQRLGGGYILLWCRQQRAVVLVSDLTGK